jgi:hypothetical protein
MLLSDPRQQRGRSVWTVINQLRPLCQTLTKATTSSPFVSAVVDQRLSSATISTYRLAASYLCN